MLQSQRLTAIIEREGLVALRPKLDITIRGDRLE
jgi:hypothetical protein